jgi:hypothetical protein
VLVVSAQLGVVEVQAVRREHRRDAKELGQRAGEDVFEVGGRPRAAARVALAASAPSTAATTAP